MGRVSRNRRGIAGSVVAVSDGAGERVWELVAAGYPELVVNPVEVPLGSLGRDEQRLRDLAVAESFGGEPRYTEFAGRERVAAGDRVASGLGSRSDQFR